MIQRSTNSTVQLSFGSESNKKEFRLVNSPCSCFFSWFTQWFTGRCDDWLGVNLNREKKLYMVVDNEFHMAEVAATVGLYFPWCISRLEPDIFDLVQLRRSLICWVVTYLILGTIPRKSRKHGEPPNYGSWGFRVLYAPNAKVPTLCMSWMVGAYMSGVDCRSNEIGLRHEGTKSGNDRIPVARGCCSLWILHEMFPVVNFFGMNFGLKEVKQKH